MATSPVPETEVIADDDRAGAERPHQHLRDERLGGQRRKRSIEGADGNLVGTGAAQQLRPSSRSGNHLRCALGGDKLHGMGVERQGEDAQPRLRATRELNRLRDQSTMPGVDAVVIARRDHRRWRGCLRHAHAAAVPAGRWVNLTTGSNGFSA
jgi:hypothetical protein